jgi:2-polyprenyl-3-methyl-5-hydroxy-6-metoxy-1,4-benzoquinol methylase
MKNLIPKKANIQELIKEQNASSDFEVDISRLKPSTYGKNRYSLLISNYFKLYFWGGLKQFGIYDRLLFSNLILSWFYEFQYYWIHELQGFNMRPHDFFFLLGDYRKNSDIELNESQNGAKQIEVWQDPRAIYFLLSQRYKVALNPFEARKFSKYISKNSLICEYGCGMAPITRSIERFFRHKNVRIHCVDIPTFPFHYIRWYFKKYKKYQFCDFIEINPEKESILTELYDVVFVLNVLEHLPSPYQTIIHITEHLKIGGFLIFNYIQSDGTTLDTKAGKLERNDTITYIKENYTIINGTIDINENIGNIVAQKV